VLQVDHKSLIQKWIHVEFENSALLSLILDLISLVFFVGLWFILWVEQFSFDTFWFSWWGDQFVQCPSILRISLFVFSSKNIFSLFLYFEVSHIVFSFSVFLSYVWFVGGSEFGLVRVKGTTLSPFDQIQTISLFVIQQISTEWKK
jgi:hypothetical protein